LTHKIGLNFLTFDLII